MALTDKSNVNDLVDVAVAAVQFHGIAEVINNHRVPSRSAKPSEPTPDADYPSRSRTISYTLNRRGVEAKYELTFHGSGLFGVDSQGYDQTLKVKQDGTDVLLAIRSADIDNDPESGVSTDGFHGWVTDSYVDNERAAIALKTLISK